MNDAKPKTVFDERDRLIAENERLLTAFENKTLECVALRNQLDGAVCACGHSRGRHITAIHGQPLGKCYQSGCACGSFVTLHEAARKVADAAVGYFDADEDVDEWLALKRIVAEYRKLREGE
jgi:hypothetical protein